jgi:tRNA-dihydrouridine synthase B
MKNTAWDICPKPIIGLSPMDGVTDAAFRAVVDHYAHPSVLVTEFTAVEGIVRGAWKLLYAFVYKKSKTPQIAQIFGTEPQAFYKTAFILAEMGFDGIDINMGCPDKHISKKGAGAGLILQPERAKHIIRAVKKALKEWSDGHVLEHVGLPEDVVSFVRAYQKKHGLIPIRRLLPVSVKTRIGFSEVVTTDWVKTLTQESPSVISLHGRTLKQLYSGLANWDEIGKAVEIAHQNNILLLGNGDVKTRADAHEKIKAYGVDGVLIGRAALGNPWVFTGVTPTAHMRLEAALLHTRLFMELIPETHFLAIRKHLAWYLKGFDMAAESRVRILQANNEEDIKAVIEPLMARLTN